jgi:hypothetical protein
VRIGRACRSLHMATRRNLPCGAPCHLRSGTWLPCPASLRIRLAQSWHRCYRRQKGRSHTRIGKLYRFTEEHYEAIIEPSATSEPWSKLTAKAGLPTAVVLHGARHTAVDMLDAVEVDWDTINDVFGHPTTTMSKAYRSQPDMNWLTVALEQMAGVWGRVNLPIPKRGR